MDGDETVCHRRDEVDLVRPAIPRIANELRHTERLFERNLSITDHALHIGRFGGFVRQGRFEKPPCPQLNSVFSIGKPVPRA